MLKLPDLSQEFAQKRVLVTGGTKGTGKAVVERMLAAGATLITAARGDKPDDIASECYVPVSYTHLTLPTTPYV